MSVAFTSDTHAYHNNIIKYSNRPFKDVDDMNKTMADNINRVLNGGGQLYHLGDWSFGGVEKAIKFREMINPAIDITLIVGNHDKHNLKDRRFINLFNEVYDLLEVKIDGKEFTLCHYSMKVWDKSHRGTFHLYGHSHGSLPDDQNSLSFDIGVDCHNFMPLTVTQVVDIMSKKTWKAIEHHV